jgi:hypothetical protein
MKLDVIEVYRNHKVFWVGSEYALAVKGYRVYRIYPDGRKLYEGALPVDPVRRAMSCSRILKHGARLGLHNLIALQEGGLLAACKGAILRKAPSAKDFSIVDRIRHGNKPALRGMWVDNDGFVYYGEYSVNHDRSEPCGIYCSKNNGQSFEKVFEFSPGEVRHIHFIQWDKFDRCLWMGTGDRFNECKILRSYNKGKTWGVIGSGSQAWRSVGLAFTKTHIYWGTDAGGPDAGTWRSRIFRWNRSSQEIEELFQVAGPCHGIGVLASGTLIISTGVEYGANEVDNRAHIYASRNGIDWEDLISWGKDLWPLKVTFGLIHFPHGTENSGFVHFTTLGLKGYGEAYNIARIMD